MLSDDYIMGLVEGEGCFGLTIQRIIDYKPRKNKRKRKMKNPAFPFRIIPSFRMTIAKKDQNVLKAMKEKLRVGNIYPLKRPSHCQPAVQYCAQTHSEIFKIQKFFENKQFITSKGEDFKKWSIIVDLMKNSKIHTNEGFTIVLALRKELNFTTGKTSKMRSDGELLKILKERPEHIAAHMPSYT